MKPLIESIYNKRLETHYNSWQIKRDDTLIKIDLQGKVKCPVLNASISSLSCSKIMDSEGWPRQIDPNCCKNMNCFVYLSIKKFKDKKNNGK